MKYAFTIIFTLLIGRIVDAQQFFSKNIDFEGQSDSGITINQTQDGFVITSASLCFDTLMQCFLIATTDYQGSITNFVRYSNYPLWVTAGTGTGNEGVILKNSDEYYFAGAIQMSTPQYDVFLMKTDNQGDTLWMKTYGNPNYTESISSLVLNSDTSFVMLNARELAPYKLVVWLQCVDINGNVLWEKVLGENYKNAGFQDMIKLSDGDLLLSYVTSEYNVPFEPYSMTVTKLDAQGNEKWTHSYTPFDGDIGGVHSCLLELDNGEYLVNYMRDAFGASLDPPILLWLDSLGNKKQQYDFPNDRIRDITDLIKTADGRLVGVGQVDLIDYEMGYTGWMFAFTQSGEPLWERFIVAPMFLPRKLAWLAGVEELDDGRLAAIGTIKAPSSIDAWLMVTDSEGCTEPGCTGVFQGFTATDGATPLSTTLSIWPNPAQTFGILDLPEGISQATLALYTTTAQPVLTQQLATGQNRVSLMAIQPGLYFWEISQDGQLLGSGKLVKVE